MYKKENPEKSESKVMFAAVSCLLWCQLERLVATRTVSRATQRSFLLMIRLCLFWQPQPELQQNICWPLSPGAGQVWPGVGGICCWVQLKSPACSPSCTLSQELEIFQSALLLSFFSGRTFTTLAKLLIQNIMNVPVVYKPTCLFPSTWNGNFLCSPSGRILHCYYKRWVNPRKWGKTAHVQLARKKGKRCTNFFWTHLDQLPCLQHELWFLLHIWEVFEPPSHFPFFTIVIWPVWFHFAVLGHLLFKIMFIFYSP